jgi:DEAD/DEAH box helicase domain-containing protein
VDELHQYRGLFGSHMALTIRRLRRVASFYGASPRFLACSATIGNPGEVAEAICGVPFTVVQGSGAARGPRTLLVWEPRSFLAEDGNARAATQAEAARLFCLLVQNGLGTILFALSRGAAESMSVIARERLGSALADRVAPYRNGYSPGQRREIEEGLKWGRLLGVVATNSLEVGVDIGGLDAAVIAGYPSSKSSLWQQAGRAGRASRPSLAVFIPQERVVDAYYAAHPELLLDGRFEDGVVDLANPLVAASHLVCAAIERPLRRAELSLLGPSALDAVRLALADGRLTRGPGVLTATGAQGHRDVGLRGDAGENYEILGPSGHLGTIDRLHLLREAFPGAVYLHAGARYRVSSVDDGAKRVTVALEPSPVATQVRLHTTVRIEGNVTNLSGNRTAARFGYGPVVVRQTATAYREGPLGRPGNSVLVPLPPGLAYELRTSGWWLAFPASLRRDVEQGDPRRFLAGLHAVEHLMPAAVSLRLLCDPRDIVAVYEEHHAGLGGAALFLFDNRAGGAGIATRAAEQASAILTSALDVVRACACKDGCPRCVVGTSCWRPGEATWKDAAVAVLSRLQDGAVA